MLRTNERTNGRTNGRTHTHDFVWAPYTICPSGKNIISRSVLGPCIEIWCSRSWCTLRQLIILIKTHQIRFRIVLGGLGNLSEPSRSLQSVILDHKKSQDFFSLISRQTAHWISLGQKQAIHKMVKVRVKNRASALDDKRRV